MAGGTLSHIDQTIAQNYRFVIVTVSTTLKTIQALVNAAMAVSANVAGDVLEVSITPVGTNIIMTDGYNSDELTLTADEVKTISARNAFRNVKLKTSSGTVNAKIEMLIG